MSASIVFDENSGNVLDLVPSGWFRRRMIARGPATRGDRGAIAVLFGLVLTSLLIVTAIVVDLGMDRATVRTLKSDTDLAAIAGGYFMAGNGLPNNVSNPRAACEGALQSIKTNIKDFPASPTAAPGSGCSGFVADSASCIDGTTTKGVVTFTGAPYVLKIEYPIYAADIANPLLAENIPGQPSSDLDDGTSACSRMRITMSRTNPAVFSGIVGGGSRVITQSTTFKVNAATLGNGVPALLILERLDCATLDVAGQGGIKVSKSGALGGWIHSDTQAKPNATITYNGSPIESNCGDPVATACNTSTANDYSIYATSQPSGGQSVIAEDNGSTAGLISTYAMVPGVNGAIGCHATSGINHQTTANAIVSRNPVDLRYNLAANPYGDNITTMHARGYGYTTKASLPSTGYGRTISSGGCSDDRVVYKEAVVLVDCPSGFSGQNVIFTGTTIVFTGKIEIRGGFLAFPNAEQIFVRGCNGCNDSNGIDVESNGFLSVNSGVTGLDRLGSTTNYITPAQLATYASGVVGAIPSSGAGSAWPNINCLSQAKGPGDGGTYDNQTILASFSGKMSVQSAEMNLCQTFAYLGASTATYQKLSQMTGLNCQTSLPCPFLGTNQLQFVLNPGSKPPVQWTAPLHNLKGPSVDAPFDDLTLWTEASGGTTCSLSGQSQIVSTGIFFMPNCDFVYGGQADLSSPVNAQFIVRTLTMAGQGFLFLQPNPDQSIQVPHPGGPEIIR